MLLLEYLYRNIMFLDIKEECVTWIYWKYTNLLINEFSICSFSMVYFTFPADAY